MQSEPYRTLDGSLVKELVHPRIHGSSLLSLALAIIMPGQTTLRHYHQCSEEVYYVVQGRGLLWIAGREEELGPGEARLIRPAEKHCITCLSPQPLHILCACSPPYRHEDTVLVEGVMV